jgi:hypothetical protein
MSKIRLNLAKMSLNDTFQHAQQVHNLMSGNPDFPSPPVPMPEYAAQIEEARNESNLYNRMWQALAEQLTKRDAAVERMDGSTTRLGRYVEATVGNNPAKILGAGFQPRAARSRIGTPTEPMRFLAKQGDREGNIDVSWGKVRGATVYEVQMSPEDGSDWKTVTMVTRTWATLSELVSGQRMTFRVRAHGTAGFGPWSDPAFMRVP